MDPKERLQYALRLKRLHELFVIKENIAFEYQHRNYNVAAKEIDIVVDKMLNDNIVNAVDGTVSLKDPKVGHIIEEALTGQQEMLIKNPDRYVQNAVEQNTKQFSNFLQNRIEKENYSLQSKIEEEYRKKKYTGLSGEEAKKLIKEKFQDYGRKRAKNIVKDALHTNQSHMSFVHNYYNGAKYKVWMNGQSKSGVRYWHVKSKIQPVEIDDFFDIYGPTGHAQMMYPGDLNGGAENVANCKCWLHYTNTRPSNLKTRGTIQVNPNVQLENENATTFSANTEKRGLFTKIRDKLSSLNKKHFSERIKDIYRNLKNFNKETKIINNERNLEKLSNSKINSKDNRSIEELIDSGEVTHSITTLKIPNDGKHEGLEQMEEFNKYEFHKYNITIYESVGFKESKVLDILEFYNGLPKPLQKAKELFLSTQKPFIIKPNGIKKNIPGFVVKGKEETIYLFESKVELTKKDLVHELFHLFDKDFKFSNSFEYKIAFVRDKLYFLKFRSLKLKNMFVSSYAYDFFEESFDLNSDTHFRLLSEDLAEAGVRYIFDENFEDSFKHTFKFLKKYVGEYDGHKNSRK